MSLIGHASFLVWPPALTLTHSSPATQSTSILSLCSTSGLCGEGGWCEGEMVRGGDGVRGDGVRGRWYERGWCEGENIGVQDCSIH